MLHITAIIPTFNRAHVLRRAIDSVLNQTLQASQVVVVDDGSTDETGRICAEYTGRIEYVRQENAGASAARNLGVTLARHPWIAFLDSDDYWTGSHLERMSAAVRATSGHAAVYFSDMQMPDADGGGTLWEQIGFRPRAPFHVVSDATAWALMKRQPTMLQCSVISREAMQRVGGLDVELRLVHDSYLFCQLGIGTSACAVSGIGCVQTADDVSSVRLTTAIRLTSPTHVAESCRMWSKLFHRLRTVPPRFRRLVRYNAASCYWEIGLNLIAARRFGEGVAHVAKAIMTDPVMALWLVRYRTRKGYEPRLRPACPELAFPGSAESSNSL